MDTTEDALLAAALHGSARATAWAAMHYTKRGMLLNARDHARLHEVRLFWSAWRLMGEPETFQMPELRRAYEALLGETIDPRNFQRTLGPSGLVAQTGEVVRGRGRPAPLYTPAKAVTP